MKKDMRIYKQLPDALLPWYAANARDLPWRKDKEPYHVWVSEIMLQQTRVEAVIGYYNRFLKALPNIKALAEATEAQLLKLWEGLGYYNRVRNLQKAAQVICAKHGGVFPSDYAEILALPGIGAYTAGAVSSICFGLPRAAVDGNVLRILSRMTASDAAIDTDETKKHFAVQLEAVYPPEACGSFTQALMELGACVCTPKSPDCSSCPAQGFCRAYKQKKTDAYPVRLPKRAKKIQDLSVFLLECGGKFALAKRGEKGLLSGLWQLPNTDMVFQDADAALLYMQEAGAEPQRLVRTMERVHVFTHIQWNMQCYHILCRSESAAYTWASLAEIRGKYALPTAFRMFFDGM